MTRVVLGSASTGRRKVLRQAGIDPLIAVSGVDEPAIIAALRSDASPGQVTTALAIAKADAVVSRLAEEVTADCVVIGCDSMLYLDGRLRGKPESPDAALREWQAMAGRTGQLFTGHCLIRLRDNAISHRCADYAVTSVRFGRPSESDMKAYIGTGEPLNVAGSFTLDGYGGWFVDGIDGDPSSVVGIGLPTVRRLLGQAGLSLPGLWLANPVSDSAH